MKVIITYKPESEFAKFGQKIFSPCTEVHYNYPSLMSDQLGIQVAFESDILGTGFTRQIKDIEQIEVFDELGSTEQERE